MFKNVLATSDFGKGVQDDINVYFTRDRLSNASFRQNLDPIEKNIFRSENPLELVFRDISTFNAQNPIVRLLLKDTARTLITKPQTLSTLVTK